MKTIWKFVLEVTDLQEIDMPKDSIILTVQVQQKVPCLWVLVEENNEDEERFIRIAGTGHPVLGTDRRYIGTFQLREGSFVGHVFEEKRRNARNSRTKEI